MSIKRYYAEADNTITNAYKSDLTTRGTGSNMGQSDILEVFSIYAQQSATSFELARTLIRFPISDISSSRENGEIPASGSVSFYLNLYNAEHSRTLPRDYYLTIAAVSSSTSASWEEGVGLDMEGYTDLTYEKTGSNWIIKTGSADNSPAAKWNTAGGDWYTDSISYFTKRFENGNEDLELDVTTLVEQWVNTSGNVIGKKDNHGFIIKLSASFEASSSINLTGSAKSYYTKKFFARSTEFFFKKPNIEARWDSTRRDNRANFYYSSSLAPGPDNLNTLFLYNYIRGRLRDIGTGFNPTLQLYYSSGSVPEGDKRYFSSSANVQVQTLEAEKVSTGVYKAQFSATSSIVTTTYPYLVDVWTVNSEEVHTGSAISPKTFSFSNFNPNGNYVITMPYLKKSYSNNETERFRLYVREKNWSPNIYSKANSSPENLMIESASYQVVRAIDDVVVLQFGTGSDYHTVLSYDVSGNYFDLDMSLLEAGYMYYFKYSFYEDSVSSWREQPYTFKFRVDKDEY